MKHNQPERIAGIRVKSDSSKVLARGYCAVGGKHIYHTLVPVSDRVEGVWMWCPKCNKVKSARRK